ERVARHRIRRITVRDGKYSSAALGARDEIAGFPKIVRYRLVANDIETGVERCDREWVMRIVGGHDRDRVDAIRTQAFLAQHFSHIAITPPRVEAQRRAACAGARRVAGENTRYAPPPSVHLGSAAMHAPDPRFGAAADHTKAQRPAESLA